MAVTGKSRPAARTVIGYLLSPLLRYKHENLREFLAYALFKLYAFLVGGAFAAVLPALHHFRR